MKILTITVLCITIFSCTPEEVIPTTNTPTPSSSQITNLEQQVLGTWKLVKQEDYIYNVYRKDRCTHYANGDYQMESTVANDTFLTYPNSISFGGKIRDLSFVFSDSIYMAGYITNNYMNVYYANNYDDTQHYNVYWSIIVNHNNTGRNYLNSMGTTGYIKHISSTELICQTNLGIGDSLFEGSIYYYAKIN